MRASARRPGLLALALAAGLLQAAPRGAGAENTAPAPAEGVLDAVQLLADATLIDGACRSLSVDFGRAFQVAGEMGLDPVAVMPAGRLRGAFEAATLDRQARSAPGELCGTIAQAYGDHVPGLIRNR